MGLESPIGVPKAQAKTAIPEAPKVKSGGPIETPISDSGRSTSSTTPGNFEGSAPKPGSAIKSPID